MAPKKDTSLIKYLTATAVAIVLVIAPLGSYFYLKSGFDYRVKYIEELEEKPMDAVLLDSLNQYFATPKVRLIHIPGKKPKEELELLRQIDRRMVDKTYFETITFSNVPTGRNGDIIYIGTRSWIQNLDYTFYLTDTSGTVRNFYKMSPDLSKTLIKHLAVLIPMPKKRQIILKRDLE